MWLIDQQRRPRRALGTRICTSSTIRLSDKRWELSGNKSCRSVRLPRCESNFAARGEGSSRAYGKVFRSDSFSIKSEMRNPNMYNRSLLLCQLSSMSFYIVSGASGRYAYTSSLSAERDDLIRPSPRRLITTPDNISPVPPL